MITIKTTPLNSLIVVKLVLVCCLLAFSSASYAVDFVSTDGVNRTGKDSFKIVKADPHFVVSIDAEENPPNNSRSLYLPLEVKRQAGMQQAVQMVLYFEPISLDTKQTFDPLHRLILTLPDRQFKEIVLPLPDELVLSASRMRLDIDNCQGCDVEFGGKISYLSNLKQELAQDVFMVEEYRLINGSRQVPKEGQNLDLSNWKPHAIEVSGQQLSVVDGDPFLVSEVLDFDTQGLGGVKIKLTPPKTGNSVYSFQLFYGTERHAFTERASSILRVAADKSQASEAIEFIVPLDFLSSRFPPDNLLTRLRLDLPDKQSKQRELWAIQSIDVINKQQLREDEHLVPSQLIHFKFQKASKRQILKGIFNKITSDLGFTIFYLCLLICSVLVILWLHRKAPNNS